MGYFPVTYDSRVVIYKHKMFIRLPTGLVVMGDNSCSRGCVSKSQRHKLDGHFSHWFVVKIVLFVWKDQKINEKEVGVGPFKKTMFAKIINWVPLWVLKASPSSFHLTSRSWLLKLVRFPWHVNTIHRTCHFTNVLGAIPWISFNLALNINGITRSSQWVYFLLTLPLILFNLI